MDSLLELALATGVQSSPSSLLEYAPHNLFSTDSGSMTMTDDATTTTEEGPGVCVVRMRGLPFAATPEDVRVFFGNTELQEVYFVRRDGELPTSRALHSVWGGGCQVA